MKNVHVKNMFGNGVTGFCKVSCVRSSIFDFKEDMMQQLLTIGQLDNAVKKDYKIYLKSYESKLLVELTDEIRGNSCVFSWEIMRIYLSKEGTGIIAELLLPKKVIQSLS